MTFRKRLVMFIGSAELNLDFISSFVGKHAGC